MRDWMRSPGHRADVLNFAYKDFGAGVSLKANGPSETLIWQFSMRSAMPVHGRRAPAEAVLSWADGHSTEAGLPTSSQLDVT
ncbi:hypothetical protein [Streptomyces alboflavus]|uniref:hypothetical protein n=1 Tax=Streptomyces alboflavus TaxID=67267 RepID=UPI000ABA96EC|nr:hypothetical protein [Streptomyces alboflavus]